MNDTLDAAALTALAAEQLGMSPRSLRCVPIATGKHNRSYWIESGAQRFVLRVAPPDEVGFLFYERLMMRQEPALHRLMRERTSMLVAEIVAHDFSRTRVDRDYVLMAALPGRPLSDVGAQTRATHSRVLRQVGEQLRRLHALTAAECLGAAAYGYLGAHRPMEPQPTWQAAFGVMWNKLLDDVVACGSYSEDQAALFRRLLERHAGHFDRPVTPRLLHMDVWAQNILVDERGELGGLVDFDRALWGDREIEFAVLDYCGISEPSFWEGYGSQRDLSASALIRRQFYLLYEVQKYMPISVWRGNDPAAARRYKQQSFALAAELDN